MTAVHALAAVPGEGDSVEVAQAIMVTVELDFGERMPTIPEALKHIERRHEPANGGDRTFAILDAYGGPTTDGKLRVSMHVSTERAGMGSLVFRRTGEVLWKSRIVQGKKPGGRPRSLGIFIGSGAGREFVVDGSRTPRFILEARIQEYSARVRDVWPEGEEREVTFLYSACGCPVKVRAKRVGDHIARVSDLPVIFPDDPEVVRVINGLMGW